MNIEMETRLRPSDVVVLAEDQSWPGVAKARGIRRKKGDNLDVVPAGSVGKLVKHLDMWAIVFRNFRADPEWPCLVGFYPAKLPPWIVPMSEWRKS